MTCKTRKGEAFLYGDWERVVKQGSLHNFVQVFFFLQEGAVEHEAPEYTG